MDFAALPPLTPTLVTVDGTDVFLYRRGEEIFAIGNECPHQGGNLCDGRVEPFLRLLAYEVRVVRG
jgi:nitrite reductase/ring-hydroxylating ferredoxin subunit